MSARRRAAAAICAIVLGGALLSSGGAGADPIGSCSTQIGTVVAVDFSHFGGPVVRGCGVGQASGYALLHAAGFVTTGDVHDGPAFVCRVGNAAFSGGTQFPTPHDDACHNTPPPDASWAFWVAPAGQHAWTYSPRGAMSDIPEPGEVELWTFGGAAGAAGPVLPAFGPDAIRAQNAAPVTVPRTTPSTRADASPTTEGLARPSAAASPVPAPSVTVSSTRPSGHFGTAATTGTLTGPHAPATTNASASSTTIAPGTGARSAALAASGPHVVDAEPAPHHSASAGSVLPVVIAFGLLAGLGGAAAAVSVRRRRAEA